LHYDEFLSFQERLLIRMTNVVPSSSIYAEYNPTRLEPLPEIPLSYLLRAFWEGRKLIVATVALFVVLGMVFLAIVPRQYTISATIGPAQNGADSGKSALGGLSMILGGGDSDTNFVKFKQVLSSTRLAHYLDEKHSVGKVLMSGWDEKTKSFRPPTGIGPTVKGAIKVMLGLPSWIPPDDSQLAGMLQRSVVTARIGGNGPLDFKSTLVSVTMKTEDRDYGIKLLTWVLHDADQIVRDDQLRNTSNRIGYLRALLLKSNEVYLNQSLQQILMNEERTAMTLQADRFYAVDLIDPPHCDTQDFSPRPSAVIPLCVLLGLILSGIVIFAIFRQRVAIAQSEDELFVPPFPGPVAVVIAACRKIVSIVLPRKAEV
jgi:LPS O-antigen subunit length determinant protein (WzzB/FepE family)